MLIGKSLLFQIKTYNLIQSRKACCFHPRSCPLGCIHAGVHFYGWACQLENTNNAMIVAENLAADCFPVRLLIAEALPADDLANTRHIGKPMVVRFIASRLAVFSPDVANYHLGNLGLRSGVNPKPAPGCG